MPPAEGRGYEKKLSFRVQRLGYKGDRVGGKVKIWGLGFRVQNFRRRRIWGRAGSEVQVCFHVHWCCLGFHIFTSSRHASAYARTDIHCASPCMPLVVCMCVYMCVCLCVCMCVCVCACACAFACACACACAFVRVRLCIHVHLIVKEIQSLFSYISFFWICTLLIVGLSVRIPRRRRPMLLRRLA